MAERNLDEDKRIAAEAGAARVEDGMVVGLGTGSTAAHLVRALAERVKGGLKIRAVPTSKATDALARSLGITMVGFDAVSAIDLTLDGADEFDPRLNLTKGGGGALLFEKVVAAASKRMIVICDGTKQVEMLGAFPLPVEVVRFGWQQVERRLTELGAKVKLRGAEAGKIFETDSGNYILDASFSEIPVPVAMAMELDHIVGVVEHGLFVGLCHEVILSSDGVLQTFRR
ncbi:MAG: ribose-5-phosphate isomerase RpiA [Myxococcota bacterium]